MFRRGLEALMFRSLNDAIEKNSADLNDAIEKGTIEGIHRGFENRAFENCDGKDNPDERCPQKSGKCICAYVYWRQLPEWKQKLVEKPPRPSEEECFEAIVTPIIKELLASKSQKQMGE
jgi:hypothetical protein